MVNIIVCGVCGRMGKRIAALATKDENLHVVGATEIKGCSFVGSDIGSHLDGKGSLGIMISPDLSDDIDKCDCVIDFTSAAASLEHVEICKKHNKPIVVGTTGITPEQKEIILAAGNDIPIIFAPNMSVGVNTVFELISQASKRLGSDYSIKVEETHHIHKKDKPSGTAKKIVEVIEDTGVKVDNVQAFREGEVVGDHKVIFESAQDIIEISHSAKNRDIFVLGALEAAKFLAGKKKGNYSMKDVLENK